MVAPATIIASKEAYKLSCAAGYTPSWDWCMKPNMFNCIGFAKCFALALQRVCEDNSVCCPSQGLDSGEDSPVSRALRNYHEKAKP